MQSEETENELILRETPGCLWIFGSFFAFFGGLFVYGVLSGLFASDWRDALMLAVFFALGALALAAGLWLVHDAPVTRIAIDRNAERVSITRYGLFGRRHSSHAFDEIEHFYLIEERDGEGAPVWSLGLAFATGEKLKISALASHDERFKRDFVFQTNEFMGKPLLSTQYIVELGGETDGEIS
jgi:hypothetical protein